MLRNGLEPWHLLIVAVVIIVLFGSRKLPEAARGLGRSMRILKREAKAVKEDGAARSSAAPNEQAPVEPVASAEPAPSHAATESNPAH